MTCKLNEIQVISIRLENKHEAIEHTIKETPKNYADIIKTSQLSKSCRANKGFHRSKHGKTGMINFVFTVAPQDLTIFHCSSQYAFGKFKG